MIISLSNCKFSVLAIEGLMSIKNFSRFKAPWSLFMSSLLRIKCPVFYEETHLMSNYDQMHTLSVFPIQKCVAIAYYI